MDCVLCMMDCRIQSFILSKQLDVQRESKTTDTMGRRQYSSRNNPKQLNLGELYSKLQHLYLYFYNLDYFKGKLGISENYISEQTKYKAALALNFQPFPITEWAQENITEDNIFDVLEFLYDHVSKPGELAAMTTETGWNYYDYESYDEDVGKKDFRDQVNRFLCDYKKGYELTEGGTILALGSEGLEYILGAEIVTYDEINVDNKVREAIRKWRNRHLDLSERKQAIRELADVFEWLKKTSKLKTVLSRKDESAIFEIANNFSIRHHDPKQKREYDESIWYSWIFHFYLATYHAVIRLLQKREVKQEKDSILSQNST